MSWPIHLYNAFDLHLASDDGFHLKVQQLIVYSESRFRQALLIITKASQNDQKWMQINLQKEVVSDLFGF
jgi:hypothetical protein